MERPAVVTPVSDAEVAFAVRIASIHGGAADTVVALPGNVNRVLRVTGPGVDWVVRAPADTRRENEFPTEIWAARQASLLGIATARLVATGELDGRPYLVLEHVEPQPEENAGRSWEWLGRYAALVPEVPLGDAPDAVFSRFGRDLPSAWLAHVDDNLDELSARDPLVEDGPYRPGDRGHLRALIERLRSNHFTFGLAHGDLAPRNLIHRRPPAPPVLLDWGTATTGPAPWTDLQRVYAWVTLDQTVAPAALEQLAEAAGVVLDDQANAVLRQMTVLRLLDLTRWARERRPDLYEQYRLDARRGLATILALT